MAAALETALPVLLFIGLPCKWAVILFLGKKKCSAAEIRVDGLVLDLDAASILLSRACSAKEKGEKTHISTLKHCFDAP